MKNKRLICTLCVLTLAVSFFCGTAAAADPGSFEIIELTPDSTIVREGDYAVSGLYTDILTDNSLSQGWFYYYSVGTENEVPWSKWTCADGMYTSCELLFNLQNLKDPMEMTFLDRFTGFIVYNADPKQVPECGSSAEYLGALRKLAADTPAAEVFDLTGLQRNPEQFDIDGYEARSKDAVLLDRDETAQQDLIADVSRDFYKSWENGGTEPMWAVFSYEDGAVFAVNLRLYMVEG